MADTLTPWPKVERREDGGVDIESDTIVGTVILRLSEDEARDFIRRVSAALGDGFERTFTQEAVRG
ncbi:hypothetical protein [Methylorubrum aminovorans]|uniref:hypothetical protein n=1 Tax=Methylorubrum aminovorans TaxID=269069 RepID=UPI003C2E2E41